MPKLPSPDDYALAVPSPARSLNTVQAAQTSTAPAKVFSGLAQMAEQEADRLADASADDALNKLREKRLELTNAPDKGFAHIKGGGVIQRPVTDEYPALLKNEIEGLGANLNGAARTKFNQRAAGELNAFKGDVYRHVAQQTDSFYESTFQSSVAVGVKEAASGLERVNEALNRTKTAVEKEMERRGLTDANEQAVFRQQYEGAIHAAAIDGMIDRGDVAGASTYLQVNKAGMSQQQVDKLEPIVKRQTDFVFGTTLATEAAKMPPKEAQAYLVKETKGNKGAWEAAQAALTQFEQATQMADRQAKGGLIVQFSDAPSFVTAAKIEASKPFAELSPAAQGELKEYMRHQAQAQADHARSLSDHAETRARQRWDENPEALATFYQLAEMPDIGAMSTQQIYSYAPAIGPKLTQTLEAVRREKAGSANRFQLDKDLLNEAIPKDLLASGKKDQLNAYKGIVERNLQNWKLQNPGKVPSLEEQTRIARSANQDYTVIGGGWFGGNTDTKGYAIKPDMKAVPKDFYDGAKAWAAKNKKPLTDQQILEKYQSTLKGK